MNDLEVMATTLGSLYALRMTLDFARDYLGISEETRTRKILPLTKRKPAQAPEPEGAPKDAAEAVAAVEEPVQLHGEAA